MDEFTAVVLYAIVAVCVIIFFYCLYKYLCERCSHSIRSTHKDLEACDGGFVPTESHPTGGYIPLPVIPNVQKSKRSLAPFPDNFHNFINNRIIPSFKNQRATGQYQFAVLVLLSEDDLKDISHMSFTPSNYLDQPLVDKDYTSMPRHDSASYGNYIVARPRHNNWHSEEEIFSGGNSVKLMAGSPFRHLWDAYVDHHNGDDPKCILLYSWNLPCSRCTKVIIKSLKDWPYNVTNVIVAHTTYWKLSESSDEHRENEDKLKKENINVKHVKNPTSISPAA